MALFNTFGVNRWLKFEVLRKSDGAGANDRDDRPPSNSGGYATSTPPRPAPTPAPTNQYSSAAYVDSQGREFGQTYSSDPNQKPTQVDKITDVAGYGQGDGNDNDNDPAPVSYGNAAAAVLGGGAEVAPVLGKVLLLQKASLRCRLFKRANPPPVVEDPPPEGVNDLFAGMRQSKQYIDELKKGFTGAVTIGERDGPSLGGAQFTNEFRDYAKSMGYEIDKGMSPMDGPSFLVRPEGWTPDAFNAHIKTQEETAATAKTAAAQAAQDEATAAAAAEAEAARQGKIKELEDALSASKGLYGELQDKYGQTQEEYTGLKSNFEELFGNYGTLTGTYDEQKAAYDDLYGQYDTLESQLGDYNTQLADQKTNYESLMGQYSDLTGQYEDTTRACTTRFRATSLVCRARWPSSNLHMRPKKLRRRRTACLELLKRLHLARRGLIHGTRSPLRLQLRLILQLRRTKGRKVSLLGPLLTASRLLTTRRTCLTL
jgi:hypothetical protein